MSLGTLTIAPRVAASLIVRLCGPRLTPIAQAAECYELRVRRVFIRAVRAAQDAMVLSELVDVLSLGHAGTGAPVYLLQSALQVFMDALVNDGTVTQPHRTHYKMVTLEGHRDKLPTVLRQTMKAGANASVPKLGITFDETNPEAVAWAEVHAAELVTEITADAQDAIRLLVVQGFEHAVPPKTTAQLIRAGIGLTSRDAGAVMKRQLEHLSTGMALDTATAKAERYARKLLLSRATTIARTETMRASNEGQHQLWQQAKEAGLLSSTARKTWITADPCPICAPLEGEVVSIDEDFSIGGDPPAHPNCRCSVGLV